MAEETFDAWIDSLLDRHGTIRQIAEQIGMTESGFFRGVKRGTLGVENLLLLAQVAEEHPSKVLRMAGKGAVADLLERLYGTPALDALTPAQQDVIETWKEIPADVRAHFVVLLGYARDVARELAARRRAEGKTAVPETRRRRRPATPRTRATRRGDAKP